MHYLGEIMTDSNSGSFNISHLSTLLPTKRKSTLLRLDVVPESFSITDVACTLYHKVFGVLPCKLHLPNKYNPTVLLPYLYKNLSLIFTAVEGDYYSLFVCEDKKYMVSVSFDTVNYADDRCNIKFFFNVDVDINKVVETYNPFVNGTRKKSKIGFFIKEYGEIVVKDFDIDQKGHTFNLNMYNEDFKDSSETIINKLNKNEAGLYLLYGDPGTGKSSFLRYLSSTVDRRFVYVPPHMVDSVFSADFLSLLVGELKGAVLLVEDAEKVLLQRDASDGYNNSSTISSILNTTDGIYSDLTKLSIICTYNCDRNQIDKAFLRKGRLKYEYKFTALDVPRARALAKAHNINMTIDSPKTIAEILNPDDNSTNAENVAPQRKVGF